MVLTIWGDNPTSVKPSKSKTSIIEDVETAKLRLREEANRAVGKIWAAYRADVRKLLKAKK